MQVYKDRGWSLAEDHINFTIGRQSFTLRQPENAVTAFRQILTNDSRQTATQQAAFLREYLFVHKVKHSQRTHAYEEMFLMSEKLKNVWICVDRVSWVGMEWVFLSFLCPASTAQLPGFTLDMNVAWQKVNDDVISQICW